jgi:hypothetical protein
MDTIRAHCINRLLIILTLMALQKYFLDIMARRVHLHVLIVIYFHVQLHTITQSVEKIPIGWIDCHVAKEIYS